MNKEDIPYILIAVWHLICLLAFGISLAAGQGWTFPVACWFVSSILSGEAILFSFLNRRS